MEEVGELSGEQTTDLILICLVQPVGESVSSLVCGLFRK
jgi:hypothetical protein